MLLLALVTFTNTCSFLTGKFGHCVLSLCFSPASQPIRFIYPSDRKYYIAPRTTATRFSIWQSTRICISILVHLLSIVYLRTFPSPVFPSTSRLEGDLVPRLNNRWSRALYPFPLHSSFSWVIRHVFLTHPTLASVCDSLRSLTLDKCRRRYSGVPGTSWKPTCMPSSSRAVYGLLETVSSVVISKLDVCSSWSEQDEINC